MPEAISTPNLVALPITSKELEREAVCPMPPNQNRKYQIAQPLYCQEQMILEFFICYVLAIAHKRTSVLGHYTSMDNIGH